MLSGFEVLQCAGFKTFATGDKCDPAGKSEVYYLTDASTGDECGSDVCLLV